MNLKYLLSFLMIVLVFSCVPESKQELTEVELDLRNPTVQRIINHELNQNRDSLFFYAKSANPTHRYLVARAFSSYQIERAIPVLDSLILDPSRRVAAMAAYSLGQIKSQKAEKSLVSAFKSQDTSSVDNILNSRILEAIGKTGGKQMLEALATVTTYKSSDTLLLLGQVRGFYQFAKRGIISDKATEQVISYINDGEYPKKVRLMAAHYLARSKDVSIDEYKYQITQALIKEQDPNIKMTLILSLRKMQDKEIQEILLSQLELEQDWRVKVTTIKAIAAQDYITGAEKMIGTLDDADPRVALAAADFFVTNGNKEDAAYYRNLAREKKRSPAIRARLYYAVFKNLPYYYTKTISATRWELLQLIKEVEDPYQKAAYISALGNDPGAYSDLIKLMEDEESIPVRNAIMIALDSIVNHEEFNQTFQTTRRYVKGQILNFLNECLDSNDPGLIAVAGDMIASERADLVSIMDSTTNIENALYELRLPRDIEAYRALEKALAHAKGVKDPVLTQVDSDVKPDFSLLDQFKDDMTVIVKTDKGVFSIELMPEHAPISVLNFLSLAKDGYYNGRQVHRVVPNFVTQLGCNRGDGFGSLDYTIRSELGPVYYDDAGYVGYASAGLHTESSQWFVTHSPTPHLDGLYTIFGKVIEGIDVLYQIEIGDKIQDIIVKTI